MSTPPLHVFVTISDIAEMAGVGRSAVANWRKRHPDFPLPNASDRFDLDGVERWLIEKGKVAGRAPRGFVLWQLADMLRGLAKPSDVMRFVLASLVYLEACERGRIRDKKQHLHVDSLLTWSAVRESSDDVLAARLLEAATMIENDHPELAELMTPGLGIATRSEAWIVRAFLDMIEEAAKDDRRFVLFEEAVSRVQENDRFRGDFSTPPDLTHLMVRLGAAKAGTVFDPAAGEGGLLLMAALGDDRDEAQSMSLVGFERDAEVMRVARSRFFLYDVPALLAAEDSFRAPPNVMPGADLVLLDPPLGTSEWGNADVYLSERWTYGVPPPKSADLAWLQVALQSLNQGGRAIVVTTPGATFRSGREATIRSELLAAGCVTAVVRLPPRLRANTSIPLTAWVLRAPGTPLGAVLLVDAAQLGDAGRSLHSLDETEIERIVRVVHAFEADPDRPPCDPQIAWRVAISDLDDANLDPTRYRPAATVDVDQLRRRREELLATLESGAGAAEAAVAAVLGRIRESR